jgi:hypothetical protein
MLANAAFLLGLTLALAPGRAGLAAGQRRPGRDRPDRRRLAVPGPATLERRLGHRRALTELLQRYLDLQGTGEPVHTWPLPGS